MILGDLGGGLGGARGGRRWPCTLTEGGAAVGHGGGEVAAGMVNVMVGFWLRGVEAVPVIGLRRWGVDGAMNRDGSSPGALRRGSDWRWWSGVADEKGCQEGRGEAKGEERVARAAFMHSGGGGNSRRAGVAWCVAVAWIAECIRRRGRVRW